MKTFSASKSETRLFCAMAIAGALVLAATPLRAINVTSTTNATQLVNTIKGPAISIVGTPLLTGGPASAGTFTNGLTSGIGINQGIVLTSGDATLVGNSNTSGSTGADFGGAGDPQLSALAGKTTFDATVLSFSFTTTTGNLFFNFVFGSDEYNEWTNTDYNDVFGFFVDGTNIALVPGTATPIAVNTVNGGNPLGQGATNPQYFHNNDNGTFPFEYDGFSTVFTVSALSLNVGQVHTIRLAIADSSDGVYDSGVFIQAGSFDEVEHEHDASVPDGGSGAIMMAAGLVSILALRRWVGARRTIR